MLSSGAARRGAGSPADLHYARRRQRQGPAFFFDGKLVPDDPAANAKVYARALDRELVAQAAWYLARWTKKALGPAAGASAGKKPAKLTQLISGTSAWTEPLRPGDHISLIGPKSPVSGHVATIIKEEGTPDRKATAPATLSTVFYISGNAAGVAQGEGAVRVEQVTREMPPASYSWDSVSGPANEYDRRKQAAGTASSDLRKTREKHAALVARMNKASEMDVAIGGVESVDLARLVAFPPGKDRDEAVALVKQRGQQTGAMQKTDAALGEQEVRYADDPTHTLHRYDDPKSLDPANAGKWRPTAEGHMWVVEVISGQAGRRGHRAGRVRRVGRRRPGQARRAGTLPGATARDARGPLPGGNGRARGWHGTAQALTARFTR